MAVYTADWINELTPTDPDGQDAKSQGDDAIREVKRTLVTSFPNVTTGDAYTGTFSELNSLVAGDVLPRDTVIMYAGLETLEPGGGPVGGWTICDGRARGSGGGNAPDLRGLFIRGAQSDLDAGSFDEVGDSGGSNDITVTGEVTDGHALTVNEIPAHDHRDGVRIGPTTAGALFGTDGVPSGTGAIAPGSDNTNYTGYYGLTSSSGGNAEHTHTFDVTSNPANERNVPAYYALMYIIKD